MATHANLVYSSKCYNINEFEIALLLKKRFLSLLGKYDKWKNRFLGLEKFIIIKVLFSVGLSFPCVVILNEGKTSGGKYIPYSIK